MLRSADAPTQAGSTRALVACHERTMISEGWQAARCAPDAHEDPRRIGGMDWLSARVPGTAAAAVRDAGLSPRDAACDFDAEDWWFRVQFPSEPVAPDEEVRLRFDGIATVAEVYLNDELILESESMFLAYSLDVAAQLRDQNELVIRCRALGPLLVRPRRPRARWRTRLASSGNLRFYRTMLLGRAPGFAAGPATVGPWRPVWLERRRQIVVERLGLTTRCEGADGVLSLQAHLRMLGGLPPEHAKLVCQGPSGATHMATVSIVSDEAAAGEASVLSGELRVPNVPLWWPHTHGEPALHAVHVSVAAGGENVSVHLGRVGFRKLANGSSPDHEVDRDGLELHVNGVQIFARGAVWTPVDIVGMAPSEQELREVLLRVRDAGMNMVRLPGTGAYETGTFHDLCDELGILVWQDFMFANFDYPIGDETLSAAIDREVADVLEGLAARPSLTVLCGNSEVEQQVAMTGLDPSLGRNELFGERLPAAVERSGTDAVYVPSAPCGGDLPFRADHGIANYFGVGAYLRPVHDARLSGVRFAVECLAFANVPDESALELLDPGAAGPPAVQSPAWKAGVPRDVGASWDFDDVRDHYLQELFGVDARRLRSTDRDRYLELSRTVTGEIMADVFGEWRRRESTCAGALVLWLKDITAGAGWGLLDSCGEPKAAYFHLKRALAPVAVWTIDEGLGGVAVHVANDLPTGLTANLRVALYRNLEQKVHEASETIELTPHSTHARNVEQMLGYFVDASWSYRFGPAAQDLIVTSLERDTDEGPEVLTQAMCFPAGRPTAIEPAARLGLQASVRALDMGRLALSVQSKRLAYGVRVDVPGFHPDDDSFSVEPGGERTVLLRPRTADTGFAGASLSALNLDGRYSLRARETP